MHISGIFVSEQAVALALVRLSVKSEIANVSILLQLLHYLILAGLHRNRPELQSHSIEVSLNIKSLSNRVFLSSNTFLKFLDKVGLRHGFNTDLLFLERVKIG